MYQSISTSMNRRKIFFQGIKDVLPLNIPVVLFGVFYAVLCIELGFSSHFAIATSLIIFAGGSQLIFITLFTAGAVPWVIFGSVIMNNSRNILYGAVFSRYIENKNGLWKLILSFFLTDQCFAVSNQYLKKNYSQKFSHYHMLGSGITVWIIWQLSNLVGIWLGNVVSDQLSLNFFVAITFLALIAKDLGKLDHFLVILLSAICSLIFYNLPLKAYVIVSATAGIILAYILNKKFKGIFK
ncbi:MAG: branched-chain amino acid ABC transporter permease [Candidatus Pelagibacter sp.]|nr:branched-chain amino acid ABC transporter permease [Candidatus Pelagibacter sp.]